MATKLWIFLTEFARISGFLIAKALALFTDSQGFSVSVQFIKDEEAYACRHCHKLAYQTQREQAHDRAVSRADTIRKRLDWDAGILKGKGCKPNGMHWRTFERLQAAHDANVKQAMVGMSAKLGLAMDRLGL